MNFMPVCQPFTRLCQAAHRPRNTGRADLHVHTTFSDGTYTPVELVSLARRAGLAAVAITDHDTLAGVAVAQAAAAGSSLEIIPGVEITAEDEGRELHLLGYYVRTDDGPLNKALQRLTDHRLERFWIMVERLRDLGVSFEEKELEAQARAGVLSRRHLALLLVKAQRAGSVHEAFQRYLGDHGRIVVPKVRLPVAEAIRLVCAAGGVASWAHPPYDRTRADLVRLQGLGLRAVEADYPSFKSRWSRQLRDWAGELGLAVTAGSDCHGPGRELGACSITAEALQKLRAFACGGE